MKSSLTTVERSQMIGKNNLIYTKIEMLQIAKILNSYENLRSDGSGIHKVILRKEDSTLISIP